EEEHLQEIVDLMLKDVKKRLAEKGIGLEVSGEAKKLLTREGYDPTLGARPLRRAIQRLVENPLAEELLAGRIKAGDVVQVDVKEGNLTFTPRERVAQETS
ncbi:MAG: ATP-dependent Clp protease ATP-binding subunit ClpC, partial [bacterium]